MKGLVFMKIKYYLFLILLLLGTLCYSASYMSSVSAILPTVADTRTEVELPILMYHKIVDGTSPSDEYTISKERFESDLKWLRDKGFTTVTTRQLIDFAEKGEALPEKPVLLTFDDGYLNNYLYAFPLLAKYHMTGVFSVIGSEIENASEQLNRNPLGQSMNSSEIKEMSDSSYAEIGSHTFNLHRISERKGADKIPGESQETYENLLLEDLNQNNEYIEKVTGSPPLLFAWPYGAYPPDRSADKILKEAGYKLSVTSYQRMNTIQQGNPECLFGLKRFLRTPSFDIEQIF